jgi:ribosomal 30S subunit maturation factor RimM
VRSSNVQILDSKAIATASLAFVACELNPNVDLIGLDVVNAESKKIGKVINVQDFGAGGMIEIEFTEEFCKANADKKIGKIENFPFKDETFPEINLKKGFIKMEMPEMDLVKE